MLERCMARIALKNGHQKDMCYDEIGLCAQNIDTIQNGCCDYLKERESSNLPPKTNMPNLVIDLEQTPTFEWCMARCGSKNQNTTC